MKTEKNKALIDGDCMMESSSDWQCSSIITAICSEFSNAITETQFLSQHLGQTQSQLRITLLFCSIFYLFFILSDIAVLGYGHAAFVLFLGRLAVVITAAIGCVFLCYRPYSVAFTRLLATTVEVVGMSAFMLVVVYRPDELPWHAMSMAIMLMVVYIYIPNRLVYSLAIALCATGAFIFLAIKVGNLKSPDLLTMTMLLLLANAFGFVAARRYHRLWREEFCTQSILKNLSVRDDLTGCFNRRYLHETFIASEMSRAQRLKLCLTVIMCDLDHFKNVNDTYGHDGGDAVLREFAGLMKKMTRKNIDSVMRYGGEEFLLILPATDLNGGLLLAERLRVAFAAAVITHDACQNIQTTASFGVATVDFALNKKKITLTSLIAAADELLYGAKNGGRDQVKYLQLT